MGKRDESTRQIYAKTCHWYKRYITMEATGVYEDNLVIPTKLREIGRNCFLRGRLDFLSCINAWTLCWENQSKSFFGILDNKKKCKVSGNTKSFYSSNLRQGQVFENRNVLKNFLQKRLSITNLCPHGVCSVNERSCPLPDRITSTTLLISNISNEMSAE